MPDSRIFHGLLLAAAIGWALAAIGWARIIAADSDDLRLEALRQVALVMVFACAVTAAAAAFSIW